MSTPPAAREPTAPLRVADHVAPITEDEYRGRLDRIQHAMAAERLDALLLTAEPNFRYLTGFNSQTWVNLTRPRYCIVPPRGDPIVIVPKSNVVILDTTSFESKQHFQNMMFVDVCMLEHKN